MGQHEAVGMRVCQRNGGSLSLSWGRVSATSICVLFKAEWEIDRPQSLRDRVRSWDIRRELRRE